MKVIILKSENMKKLWNVFQGGNGHLAQTYKMLPEISVPGHQAPVTDLSGFFEAQMEHGRKARPLVHPIKMLSFHWALKKNGGSLDFHVMFSVTS